AIVGHSRATVLTAPTGRPRGQGTAAACAVVGSAWGGRHETASMACARRGATGEGATRLQVRDGWRNRLPESPVSKWRRIQDVGRLRTGRVAREAGADSARASAGPAKGHGHAAGAWARALRGATSDRVPAQARPVRSRQAREGRLLRSPRVEAHP